MLTRFVTFYFAKRCRATCCFLQHLTASFSTSEGQIIWRMCGTKHWRKSSICRIIQATAGKCAIAPSSTLELTYCQCSRSSCTKNCSCSSNGLGWTEACRCMADDNCLNPNKSCSYDSDDELDGVTQLDVDDYRQQRTKWKETTL